MFCSTGSMIKKQTTKLVEIEWSSRTAQCPLGPLGHPSAVLLFNARARQNIQESRPILNLDESREARHRLLGLLSMKIDAAQILKRPVMRCCCSKSRGTRAMARISRIMFGR